MTLTYTGATGGLQFLVKEVDTGNMLQDGSMNITSTPITLDNVNIFAGDKNGVQDNYDIHDVDITTIGITNA